MSHRDITANNILHAVLQNKWLQRSINLLLIGWLGWLAVSHTMPYFKETAPASSAPVQIAQTTSQTHTVDGQEIADWHLFGTATPTEQTIEPDTLNAPDTHLKLALKGIVATDDVKKGYAIIQKPDKQEKHFSVNDSVFDLATLEEIYVDRVILLRNGKYETLRLPVEFMATDLYLERQRKMKAKRIVSNLRQKLVNRNGMELIKMFGFDTAYKNGSFIGFTINAVGEDGPRLMKTLGVEENDLITVVNGKRLSESLEAVQSLTELKDATEVDIEIERHGVPMSFHFELDPLVETAEIDDSDDEEFTEEDTLLQDAANQ